MAINLNFTDQNLAFSQYLQPLGSLFLCNWPGSLRCGIALLCQLVISNVAVKLTKQLVLGRANKGLKDYHHVALSQNLQGWSFELGHSRAFLLHIPSFPSRWKFPEVAEPALILKEVPCNPASIIPALLRWNADFGDKWGFSLKEAQKESSKCCPGDG